MSLMSSLAGEAAQFLTNTIYKPQNQTRIKVDYESSAKSSAVVHARKTVVESTDR